VAGRSRRFNFSTDAGHRFERGVDPSQTVEHIERITQLVLDICGGQAGSIDDQQPNMPVRSPVQLRVARASKVIGMPVTAAQCLDAFKRLGLPATEAKSSDAAQGVVITVTPPAYRFDITIEEDLIEEVVRLIGFNNLPTTAPIAPVEPQARSETQRGRFAVRRALAALGYQETISFSFVEERWETELAGNANPIRLLNPIASQMNVMRSSLLGSLLQILKHNLDRKADRVRIFELGRVFVRDTTVKTSDTQVAGIQQPLRIAGLAFGGAVQRQWSAKDAAADFFDVKGDVESLLAPLQATFVAAEHPAMHPGRCAKVMLDGKEIGVIGELHPRWKQGYELAQAPILFELDLAAVMQRDLPAAKPLSKYQDVERDIAVIVREGVSHAALMAAIHAAPTHGLLQDALLFDVYRPKDNSVGMESGEKSLAVRLTLARLEATLTEEQIETVVAAVLEQLRTDLGARLRA
jgi:phenylalanyl-tRNA synthetase beta chain